MGVGGQPETNVEMAFYAYYPTERKITYRTTRVETAKDGSYTIHTRVSPDEDEQVAHYNKQGKLIKRLLPGGQVILPTTKQQLSAIWKIL